VCPLDVTVLVSGEAGTGKSTVARVIHEASGRFGKPFVEADCARIPAELLERELFGVGDDRGRLAAADGGTLYIDDIQTLPASVQTKLLHFLETGTYYTLMSASQLGADVRILAGGCSELERLVEDRHFRADLHHRLQLLRVHVPTLAERGEDLVELAQHLVDAACRRHRLRALTLSRGARRALQSVEWPGNVRELGSVVEAGAVRASGERATRIEVSHLFPDAGQQAGEPLTFQAATRAFQRQYLIEALRATGGNVLETARRLDLARSHVYHLINAFEIDMESVRR
jgi:DNA-binding NtrC family response regulator